MSDSTQTYSPGLEGVVAGESAICQVHAEAVLLYRGYDVHELAGKIPFERVAGLLLDGELPGDARAKELADGFRAAMRLPSEIVGMLLNLPRDTHPMDALRTGVSMAAAFEPQVSDNAHAANVTKAIRLTGVVNALTAAWVRVRQGLLVVAPADDLPLAGNLLYMLRGERPAAWEIETLDAIYTLYAEHDFNAGTFAARVVASTLSDLHSAVVAAVGALKGQLHGGANEEAMKVLEDAKASGDPAAWAKQKLAAREKVMGFGHRVYKKGDSRTPILRELCRRAGERTGQTEWVGVGEVLEKTIMDAKGLPANADLYAAPLFRMLNIPSDTNTALFACSRVVGWSAHVVEQHDANRLIRPRSLYTGPERRGVPS